jgi:glycosyltransferase involved in cell wall biosynthesis
LKNYANLIRWVGELTAAFPKVHLLLIGDGEERLALEALIKELHLGDRVRLLGHREDIPEMLGTMDIFAFPSLSEGLPRAVMEAMAAGLPCVVMDVGGNAEAVVDGHTGYVVPPGDGPGFKAALTRLLRDGELRKKLGAAGKKRAFTLFNPKRLAAEYEALYRSVLNRNQGH